MTQDSLTRDHIIWAYRLLLDREPEGDEAILPKLKAWRTARELRTDIMSSQEFRQKNPDPAAACRSTLVIKLLPSGARLFVDLADHVIGLGIIRDRYEQDERRFATSVLRPGDTALDVGAHIGLFTIEMAQAVGPTGQVYAFEPLGRNAHLLEQSIGENGFASRVRLEHVAVTDKAGTGTLRYARETLNTGGAFLSDLALQGFGELAAEAIRTVRLDDLTLKRPVRLIKMDVEGGEPKVVAGARELIAADGPVVIAEVHPEQLARVSATTPAAFIDQLGALGLRPHRIVDGRLGPRVDAAEIAGVSTLAFVLPS